MKKYQIVEIAGKNNDAGTKAVQDAAVIAERSGFIPVRVRMCTTKLGAIAKIERQIGYWRDWNAAYRTIEENSVVLLQNPFHHKQLTREKILRKLKQEKKVKFISLVHDVEELRKFRDSDYYRHEFNVMLELADVLIVHNARMADFFRERGVTDDKLVVLEIFDYLQEEQCRKLPAFEKKLIIAGNLDTKKCAYIKELPRLKGVDIQLYGPNFDTSMKEYPHIHYGGSLAPNEIPQELTGGFGLVWDGTSIEGCQGDAGQYLRYNNPHKLSLYLSSGLPVVIWSGAAEADFVKKNGVGIAVDALSDVEEKMNALSAEKYDENARNVQRIADGLRNGQRLKASLERALQKMRS